MPGSLISSLLRFIASHLVLLVFSGFLVAGLRLFGVWGEPLLQAPLAEIAAARPHSSPVGGAGAEIAPPMNDVRDHAPGLSDPGGETTRTAGPLKPPATIESQPPLIGGTLPNYASGGAAAFRPPVAAAVPETTPSPTSSEMTQVARRAFWNGDFEAAEAHYIAAITRYPDEADLFGELGNLYHAMGKSQRAMDAFYAAAVRLRAEGRRDKLSEVIDLLEAHDYPGTAGLRP